MKSFLALSALSLSAGAALAQSGSNIQADAAALGAPLVSVQLNATQFGNSSGTQNSIGGSELNTAWGNIAAGRLNLLMTGNLEANFNKLWIFFDDGSPGVNQLAGGYSDGGFNEINNMTGLRFDSAFSPSRGIRVEVGPGFLGVRGFTLNGAPGYDIFTAGGPGSLALSNISGANGVNFGWDNSNALGVDSASAAGALFATTGWNFSIDLATYFGNAALSSVKVMAFITSPDAGFASNQFLGSLPAGYGNLGNLSTRDFNNDAGDQFFTIVPTPGALPLLALAGLAAARRRRA
jgi:hypothetical protein